MLVAVARRRSRLWPISLAGVAFKTLTTSFQSCVFMITCGVSAPKNRVAIASSASPIDALLNADEIVCCRSACCDATSSEAAMLRERCC